MPAARKLAALAALSIFTALAGCATTHGNLSSSADRLARNADELARNATGDSMDGYPSGYSQDARRLADEASDFRRTLSDSRADDRDVRGAFNDLSRDYHALRDNIDRSNSREAQADFHSVTEAYLDVEREMGHYASSDNRRYARDRDRDDRDRY
jgi:hypothetical protein